MANTPTVPTPKTRTIARETLIDTLQSWLFIIDESGADELIDALSAKGIALVEPGMIMISHSNALHVHSILGANGLAPDAWAEIDTQLNTPALTSESEDDARL